MRIFQVFSSRISWLQIIFVALILSGCTHHQTKAPVISQNWAAHKEKVESIQNWQATGKLAVKVPNDGGSASVKWQQSGKTYQIDLNGPFGSGKVTINGLPDGVALTEAGQAPQHAKTAEELVRKNTGWNIPVTQLAFWVRGLPDPNSKIIRFAPNEQGLIGELEQLGWKVSYGEYLNATALNNNIPMPGRIIAEYNDVRLTLVVREWQFDALESPLSQPVP
ncbi:MAG: outer membrane lipoprotein LolB [Gammaproteobacteria bacterium]|nr:MAG: outer membrane lipoprotein LolB [Gammaproteobacteria bacterium]